MALLQNDLFVASLKFMCIVIPDSLCLLFFCYEENNNSGIYRHELEQLIPIKSSSKENREGTVSAIALSKTILQHPSS